MSRSIKTPHLFLLVLLMLGMESHGFDRRQVSVTTNELSGFGDWDGDGDLDVVIIDRTEGTYRTAMQQTDHSLEWRSSRPTGIVYPEHLSVHRLTDLTRDQIVVSSAQANRVHVITPGFGSAPQPLFLAPQRIGPLSAVAIDVPRAGNDPARADLIVQTNQNGAVSDTYLEYFQSTSSGVANDGTATLTSTMHLLNASRVKVLESGPEYYAGIYKPSTVVSNFIVATPSAGALPTVATSLSGLQSSTLMVHAPLRADLPDRNIFVFYFRGADFVRIAVPDENGLLTTAVTRNVVRADSLHITRTSTGGYGLFIIHYAGTSGRFYTLDSLNNLVPGDEIALDGSSISGVLAYAPDHLVVLSDGYIGGVSGQANHFHYDGTSWNDLGAVNLPAVGRSVALNNVYIFNGEPLVNERPLLLRTLQVPDWTSAISIGGSLGVTRQLFSGESAGLGAQSAVILGAEPGATHALINQMRPDVAMSSVDRTLGDTVPEVRLNPPPGEYKEYVSPRFEVVSQLSEGDTRVFYRTSFTGPWSEYNLPAGAGIPLPLNARLWYYAQSVSTGRKSTSYQVDYRYINRPDNSDTDRDGVPDFVEVARGLDPRAGEDSDGDGFSDLSELSAGTSPSNIASRPTEAQRIGAESHFTLYAKPLAHDGLANGAPTLPAWPAFSSPGVPQEDHPNTPMRVFDLDGRMLMTGITDNNAGSLAHNPSAEFVHLPAGDRDGFVVVSTPATWQANRGFQNLEAQTPELLALVPAPVIAPLSVDFDYSNPQGILLNATLWINAYNAALAARVVPTLNVVHDYRDTVELLLVERLLARKAAMRGLIGKEKLTLTAYRDPISPAPAGTDGWQGNFVLTSDQLTSLTQGHESEVAPLLLQNVLSVVRDHMRNSGTAAAVAFDHLAKEFHRLYVEDNGENPGAYGNPFDHLREIVQDLPAVAFDIDGIIHLPGDPMNLSYVNKIDINSAEMASAEQILLELLGLNMDRPSQLLTGTWTSNELPFLVDGSGDELALLRADGSPYPIGGSFGLTEGTRLRVLAFTDRFAHPSIEVISVEILSIVPPPIYDQNSDLMDDELHQYWFANVNAGPWDDDDNDGYSNFQELLESIDPKDPTKRPSMAALPHHPPRPRIALLAQDLMRLDFDFPGVYADRVGFEWEYSGDLSTFEPSGYEAEAISPSVHGLDVDLVPELGREFYRFRMYLRTTFVSEGD